MKKLFLCLIVVALMSGLAGCAQPADDEVVQSDLATMVDGNSAFAFNLYQALREEDGNLFYSPYSISLALAMTYAGARGETSQQMADTLNYLLPQDRLHPAFNSLDIELSQRGEDAKGEDEKDFRLNIANAIWGQEGYEFLSEFLDILAENYSAGLRPLDFANAPEESRITINNWASDQTEGRIEDLIPEGLVNDTTSLVLTNAIYFNAAWQYPFMEEVTDDRPFYLLDGGKVTVPMMRQGEEFSYAEGNGYQAVELPHYGGEVSMLILLPQADQFEVFERSLDAQQVSATLGKLERQWVSLTMPRFEFKSGFSLEHTLSAMGMPDAFVWPSADFSGMTGNQDLFIEDVIHKTFISVDEAGTEAAAATAIPMPPSSQPLEPEPWVEVTIDHPFIFLIRDIETGTILFIGRVVNPST